MASSILEPRLEVRRPAGDTAQWEEDSVAVECPVALVYNGISHAVMMATPEDLEDFAVGFSLSEGILRSVDELYEIELEQSERGVSIHSQISARQLASLKDRRRSLAGRTGCGLCGIESLAEAVRPVKRVCAPTLNNAAVQQALVDLKQHQPLQAQTGASHAAAWCTLDGKISLVREDVGRHNALDKLIGALFRGNFTIANGFALISSRASYEMVHKSCSVGIGALVAVSAPTSLAIDQARQAGQMLIGFARPGRHVVYSNPSTTDQGPAKTDGNADDTYPNR